MHALALISISWWSTSSSVFSRWRQCAQVQSLSTIMIELVHIGATWRIHLNLCFLWPTWVQNSNGKLIVSAVFAQLAAESPYAVNGRSFPPKLPLPMGIWTPSNTWFLGASRANNPNGILISWAVFAQIKAECPYTLQWDAPCLLKIAPSHGHLDPPSNTWFPGPTLVLNSNSSLIGSAVFAWLTSVTDWLTDRETDWQTRLLCR